MNVWELCHGQSSLRYFAKRKGEVAGGCITTPRQLETLRSNTGWDLYVHINPSVIGKCVTKASSADVTHLTNILIDIDPVSPGAVPFAAMAATLKRLGELTFPGAEKCVSIINSGRGVQGWLRLAPPLELTPELRSVCERATARFLALLDTGQYGCRVDTSCSDLCRVARLPGSVNQKSQQFAGFFSSATEFFPVDSLLAFDPGPPDERDRPDMSERTILGLVLPHVSYRAYIFLTDGVSSPGRHAAAYAAAASLRDLNVREEVAAEWVADAAKLCSPPLSKSEAIRTTRNAYSK